MPYKDKEQAKNYAKEAMRRKREGITSSGITGEGITVEMVPPLGRLPERPRYLVLSDGQVLGRANAPKADLTLWPGWKINALRNCNRADKMKPLQSRKPSDLMELYDYRYRWG